MPDANFVSQADFARLMGVSRMAVSKWKSEDKLVFVDSLIDVAATKNRLDRYRVGGSAPKKSVDAEVVNQGVNRVVNQGDSVNRVVNQTVNHEDSVDEVYNPEEDESEPVNHQNVDEVAAEILRTTGTSWSLDEAKRVKESFLALRARLRYDLEAAAVVPVVEVVARVTAEYAAIRTRLLAIPSEHAPQIARLRTPAEVRDYLEKIIVEVLTALSSGGAPDVEA